MNKLGVKNRQNRWRPEIFYNDLTIDDLFIDQWFGQFNPKNYFDDDITQLVIALDLWDDNETEKVWHYLGQLKENDHYYVPILTCPDDLDLCCSVVVVEQLVSENSVKWLRYGFLIGDLDEQNPTEMKWFSSLPTLEFDKQNFIDTFQIFASQIKSDRTYYGKNLNIKIPADPPKEDWELIVDSWYD